MGLRGVVLVHADAPYLIERGAGGEGEGAVRMAEDYVSRDQHRADLAELRLELANTLASLDKRTELLARDMQETRREMADLRIEMRELRQTMERFQQTMVRQMWTMISVVAFAVLTGVIKLVLLP